MCLFDITETHIDALKWILTHFLSLIGFFPLGTDTDVVFTKNAVKSIQIAPKFLKNF
jgi:hypothetical protein